MKLVKSHPLGAQVVFLGRSLHEGTSWNSWKWTGKHQEVRLLQWQHGTLLQLCIHSGKAINPAFVLYTISVLSVSLSGELLWSILNVSVCSGDIHRLHPHIWQDADGTGGICDTDIDQQHDKTPIIPAPGYSQLSSGECSLQRQKGQMAGKSFCVEALWGLRLFRVLSGSGVCETHWEIPQWNRTRSKQCTEEKRWLLVRYTNFKVNRTWSSKH